MKTHNRQHDVLNAFHVPDEGGLYDVQTSSTCSAFILLSTLTSSPRLGVGCGAKAYKHPASVAGYRRTATHAIAAATATANATTITTIY